MVNKILSVNDGGIIGHKSDSCIIWGPKFLPQSIRKNMNQFNVLRGVEPTKPLIYWNPQPPEVHFKSHKYSPKHSTVVSNTLGIINHNAVYNGDVEVYP